MLTESQISAGFKKLAASGKKSLWLKDGGSRGTGRLALVIRAWRTSTVAEWYAVAYRAGERDMTKIGAYPAISLKEARKLFAETYAPAIASGAPLPDGPHKRVAVGEQRPSLQALFDGFLKTIEGKAGYKNYKNAFARALKVLGPDKLACELTPEDLVGHLATIYARGKRSMAKETRGMIGTAFRWAMKAEFDYKNPGTAAKWNLKANPVDAIASDPGAVNPGQRFLSTDEFRLFWNWLERAGGRRTRFAPAIRLNMVCGQRWVEMLALSDRVYDPAEQMLYWEKTKNGGAHSVPLPSLAVRIIAELEPNRHGLYFPNMRRPAAPGCEESIIRVVNLFRKDHPEVPKFTPRDIRRTWKTLTGQAGISREMRDKLQNHAQGDVGSKHYDRYDYLPERRQAMMRWNAFVEGILAGELRQVA